MNLRQFKYKKEPKYNSTEILGGIALTLMFIWCVYSIYEWHNTPTPEILDTGSGVMYMWRYESTPADRKEILDTLTAMECIDAGLCELVVKLPLKEW